MNQYYISEVDKNSHSVYVYHGEMGEDLIPPHTHQKGQFLYTEGGIVFVKVNDQTFYLPSRHFMWIAPDMIHSIHPSSDKVVMRNLYFPISDKDSSFYIKSGIYPANDLILELLLYSQKWDKDMKVKDPEHIIALAFKLLLSKSQHASLPLSLPYPKDSKLIAIINYLSENVLNRVSLTELAKQFNISTRSLSRLFNLELKMSFIQYFTILKLLKALEFLIDSKYSIKEICLMLGYNSVPTFSNTFYKMLGMRPVDYKKMKRILN